MAKKTPLQKAKDGMSGKATHRRIAALDASMAPKRGAAKPKPKVTKPKAKVLKPAAKHVAARKAKIAAQQAADRRAIAAMKAKKKKK